jgi:TRAP-type C4-dicarboxylate transport system permease large subunit
LVKAAGIDPVYFGVMFFATAAVGVITPPVSAVLNAVINISDVPFASAARAQLVELAILVLPVLFPYR